MKAISIKQPWASLIVCGIKDIENRTWACPKKYIGERVLIHASKVPECIYPFEVLNAKQETEVLSQIEIKEFLEYCTVVSAIIGSVEIVDCVINHSSIWADKTDNYTVGMNSKIHEEITDKKIIYNWVLANPVLFPEPIFYKGKLSFWEYPNIHVPEPDEDGHGICMCSMNVKEESQVINMIDHFECRYCGGRWYK